MARRIPSAYLPNDPYGLGGQQALQDALARTGPAIGETGRESDSYVDRSDPGDRSMGGEVASAYTDPVAVDVPGLQADTPAASTAPVNTRETRDALGGYAPVGTMLGFNTGDYDGDTKARNSMKNTFGRVASRYGADAAGLQALMQDPDFQRYFPNAQLGEDNGRGGMINFGGSLSDFESGTPVGLVDVLNAYDGNTSQGWQWLDQANDGGSGAPAQGGLSPDLVAALSGLGDTGGTLEDIQRELDAVINGRPSPTNQRYLQSALEGL
jgi:hypothetical protein